MTITTSSHNLSSHNTSFRDTEHTHHDSDDDDELQHWESQIVRLDYTRYTGLRRLQVRAWLLFEDSSSSLAAVVIQTILLLLIVLSTVLILVNSFTNCYYLADLATNEPCIINATYAPPNGCTRVCDKQEDFHLPNFIIEAICIGAFTIEFCVRLLASPATVGLCSFLRSPANMIDLLAIVPFYIELSFLVSSGSSGSGANALAVLRIVRLTRVLRVVKKSKSLSGLLVLLRTLMKSLIAVLMIVTFAVLACVVCSSLMHSTPEVGSWKRFDGSITSDRPNGYGMYIREDGQASEFANMGEIWWWCLQTLTSEGYGVPWVPVTFSGKLIGIAAALLGTIVLALPIAVIGMHFDDEWGKNRKEQKFEAASRVARYNAATQYGTQPVKPEQNTTHRLLTGFMGGTAILNREPSRDENFTNQPYNVQCDLSQLLDDHFSMLRNKVEQTLEIHRDKLRRSISTDLKTVIRERSVSRARVRELMDGTRRPVSSPNRWATTRRPHGSAKFEKAKSRWGEALARTTSSFAVRLPSDSSDPSSTGSKRKNSSSAQIAEVDSSSSSPIGVEIDSVAALETVPDISECSSEPNSFDVAVRRL